MNQRGEETRERIILAAIECIERLGVSRVTVRDIAAEASVNVASVNYHFGSKESLVAHALDRTIGNSFDDLDAMLEKEYSDPGEALSDLFGFLLDGVQRYGGIARAHLEGPFLTGDYRGPLPARLNRFMSRFLTKLAGLLAPAGRPAKATTDLTALRLEQGISALLFRAMMPGFFNAYRESAPGGDDPAAYVAALSGGIAGEEETK